ncbi:uncharacterized protein LOC115621501 [Scaptodrosophila lebanonensis]|uniref:Uncharacterized protein LOC115621501 n=1 Tax=Drosophila lebanonensis TaxID=7225 RepID=A0A6J2T4T2_DROLE|nr:uncharacterized protein LOC115621501 [Scaptodrosophila lebanonensis]
MKVYKQRLRDVWLQMPEFKGWLRRDPQDPYRAYCSSCNCGLKTKISDLRAHAITQKHLKSRRGGAPRFEVDQKPFDLAPVQMKTSDLTSSDEDTYSSISHLLIKKPPKQEKEQSVLYEDEQSDPFFCPVNEEQISICNQDIFTKAISIISRKSDPAQVFGDFVADRLRQINSEKVEIIKDKITQVLLEATTQNRKINNSKENEE